MEYNNNNKKRRRRKKKKEIEMVRVFGTFTLFSPKKTDESLKEFWGEREEEGGGGGVLKRRGQGCVCVYIYTKYTHICTRGF